MSGISSYNNSIVKDPLTMTNGPLGSSSPNISESKEFRNFSEVTQHAVLNDLSLEHEEFTHKIKCLVDKLSFFSDNQLIQTIHYLCLWKPSPKSQSPNYKLLWNALDYECVHRISNWDFDRKLLVADYWFHLRLNRISQFNRILISDLLENMSSLSNSQVIQLMFYINLQRNVPQNQMRNIEETLKTMIQIVSIEEVGIICLGFFKTENKITDFNTISLIMDRFCKELPKANVITIVAVLKFLKKSLHKKNIDSYILLLHRCVPYIKKWDILASVHLALLATECHIYHPLLLNAVTEIFGEKIESARIKDCTKLLQCLSQFNHLPESKFHKLFSAEVFKKSREEEINLHPEVLPFAALYYAYLGKYDYHLLKIILAPKFKDYCKRLYPKTQMAFAELDYCIDIECKDYVGPRLSKVELGVLKYRRGNMPKDITKGETIMARIMQEIYDVLGEILKGEENILIHHVLPHMYSPDIIVRLTQSSEPLSSLYGNFPPECVLTPPSNEVWACFVAIPASSTGYKTRHLVGISKMKLRQLEKIGYRVAVCPFYEFPRSFVMKRKYIQEKLYCLKNSCESITCGNKTFL
ncbi:FAST kinase domain-containing protein 5, mitochondrial [Caerostris darwini]|uniref:FAST kinase domain-containing protein 5, mitochondrial n=1 Tax=Caerostris darwini TaxID=1538125 RepID=A0AAV4W9X1_9ARAC|nr:FAST kinase domain-containing protein 5, mitochondrial [Caerostris darwini]